MGKVDSVNDTVISDEMDDVVSSNEGLEAGEVACGA